MVAQARRSARACYRAGAGRIRARACTHVHTEIDLIREWICCLRVRLAYYAYSRSDIVVQAVSAYTSAPSSVTAAAAEAAIRRDKQAFELNARMAEMFSRVGASSSIDLEVVNEHKRLAQNTSILAFSRARLENQDFTLEVWLTFSLL